MTERATLYIAGGTKSTQREYADELRHLATKLGAIVEFIGHVDDIASWLAHADVSLCASTSEASPLAVWEAAAAGVPIVSTDVGDVARNLQNEVAALIVPVGDVAAITSALERLARDPSLRTNLGTAARDAMRQTTSRGAVAAYTRSAYEATV